MKSVCYFLLLWTLVVADNQGEENFALGVGPDGEPLEEVSEGELPVISDVASDDSDGGKGASGWIKCTQAMSKCRKNKESDCFRKFSSCVSNIKSIFTRPPRPLYTRNPRIQCMMACVRKPIAERRACRKKCPPLRG